MKTVKCFNCCNGEADHKMRTYICDGKKISGTRNFCCDKCEDEYCAMMDKLHPNETPIVRVEL